jgi:hypothetical protein
MAGGANTNIGRAFLQQSGMLGNSNVPSYIPPSQLSTQKSSASPASQIAPMPTMRDNFAQPVSQQTQTPQVSPIVQQMANRIAMQNTPFNSGLQNLYSQFSGPQMQMPVQMPMPQYQNPALSYRPNIQAVQQNLTRVKPSVYKSELDAAKERIAQYEAAEQSRQQEQNNSNYWAFNQG